MLLRMIVRISILSITIMLLSGCYKTAGHRLLRNDFKVVPDYYTLSATLSPVVYFPTFKTRVSVSTNEAVDSIQLQPGKGFCEAFNLHEKKLGEEILQAVFDWYIKVYPKYKEVWIMRGRRPADYWARRFPPVTNPAMMKFLISPDDINVAPNARCEDGTFGIRLRCRWELWTGVGIEVKNWRVVQVGFEDIIYQYMFPNRTNFLFDRFLNMPSAPLYVNYD
jgi:hypothetical protein